MIRYENNINGVDWNLAAEVFRLAPLGTREPEKLGRAFLNSYATVIAYDDQKLIGLARAICDGEYQAAIYDVVLLPEYQKTGIGRKMVEALCAQLPVQNTILYAVPGREAFYRKCGFRRMLTAMAMLHPCMSNPNAGYLEKNSPNQAMQADGAVAPRPDR